MSKRKNRKEEEINGNNINNEREVRKIDGILGV